MKRSLCPHCKRRLEGYERIHEGCINDFADAQQAKSERAAAKRAQAAAKVDREGVKARKEAIKTIPDLIKEAQREFNSYIRERDHDKPCICCGRAPRSSDVGGAVDCGHFRSVGSASHLRFDERNAHAQAKVCNRYGAGRAVDYRIGLIARIGREAVEALESDNRVHRWTREELIAIKETYRRKAKELKEKRL